MSYFDQLLKQAETNDRQKKTAGAATPATPARKAESYFDQLLKQAETNDNTKNAVTLPAAPQSDGGASSPVVPVSRAIEESNARIRYNRAKEAVEADKHSIGDIYSNDFAAREADRARREDNEKKLADAKTLMQRLGLDEETDPTLGERIVKTLTGSAKLYGAQGVGVAESAANVEQAYRDANPQSYARDVERTWVQPTPESTAAQAQQLQQLGSQLKQSGSEDVERAQRGLGTLGRLGVQAAVAATQMGADVALGALTGGGSMLPMVVRSFGGGVQEAREKGYSAKQQVALGLANAATEWFTEKLFGGNPAYDTDVGLVNRLVEKVTKNERLVSALSSLPADIISEGLEEIIADVLEPISEKVVTGNWTGYDIDRIIEDGAVGMLLGGVGQGGNAVVGAARGTNTQQSAARALPDDAGRTTTSSEGNLTSAANSPAEAQKTASGEAELYRFVDGDDTAGKDTAINEAYNRVTARKGGVVISDELLAKYDAINRNPAMKLIDAVKDFYEEHLKGQKVDVQLNNGVIEVKFENDGKKKAVGWRMKPDKAASFERLLDLTRNAEYAYSEVNRKPDEAPLVPRFHYFIGDALVGAHIEDGKTVGGVHMPVKIQVRDLANGNGSQETRYYTHNLEKSKAGSDSPVVGANGTYIDSNAYTPASGSSIPDATPEVNTQNAPTASEPAAKPLPGGVNSQTFGNLDEPSAKPLPTGTESGNDGLGAADAGSVNTDYDRLQAESDTFHPSGPSPVRHTDVPTKNFEGRNIPKSTSTIYGAQGTPDAAVMQLEQMIADGTLAFDTITDKDAVAKARGTLDRKGFDGALEQYRNTVASNAVSKNNTALGQQLLLQAMREGNTEATAELLTLYTRNSTNTAQALQAQSIFRKLSPEGQLVGIQKAVDSFNEKHGTEIKISEEDVGAYLNAENDAEREAVRERIYKNVAQQTPGSFRAKFDAIRYLAMLGNPRTHIRNILGNVLFQAPVTAKNRVGAVGEIIASAASGGNVERTKSLTGVNPFGDLAKEVRADFEKVKGFLGQTSKYAEGQAAAADIEKNVPAFGNGNFIGKGLNFLSEGNSALLEAEDTAAKKFIYTQSLAGYLKANGVKTMQGLDSTEEGRALLSKARNYAAQEAMRNTFNDRNKLSDAVASLGRLSRSDNPYVKGLGYVVEGALPFKRTPANILSRSIEYSPVGAADGIVKLVKGAKAGDAAAVTQGIDRLASGLTGSALMLLGWTLAGAGYIRGGEGDDEKQAAFDDLRGHQNYSLELGDGTSVTLDWLAPEAIPFFMGAELYNSSLENGMSFDDVRRVFKNATSPMLEMSMLQGLNNLFDNAAYAQRSGDNVMMSIATSALTNYLTQTVPTVFGQAERTFGENERMTTYTDKNKWMPTDWQYTLGKVSQKVPGVDYNQIPYIDAWGRTEETGSLGKRAASNFANPAFLSQISDDGVEDELQRIYDMTGEGGVLPQRAARYFTVNGERKDLTADEYVAYATEKGQLSRQLIDQFLGSDGYAQMDDAARAKAISELYSYANAKAKETVFGVGLNSTEAKIDELDSQGVGIDYWLRYQTETAGLTADKDANGNPVSGSKKAKQMAVIDAMPLTGEQKDALYLAAGLAASTIDDAPWHKTAPLTLPAPGKNTQEYDALRYFAAP